MQIFDEFESIIRVGKVLDILSEKMQTCTPLDDRQWIVLHSKICIFMIVHSTEASEKKLKIYSALLA